MELVVFFIVIFLASLSISSSQPHHFLKPNKLHYSPPLPFELQQPQESIELTHPLTTTDLPSPSPECTLSLLRHSFSDTMSKPPFTVPYSPPCGCPPPWSHAVLHLSGAISGNQYDRIAAVWLSGAEILRTSTPEPSDSGTFWNVRKDVTRYSSLLQQSNASLSMMLENLVNDEFTGVYHVNLTILFYKDDGVGVGVGVENNGIRKLGLGLGLRIGDFGGDDDKHADLVIPVSDEGNEGYWFRIEDESNVGLKRIEIPMNARRMVLELYVSFHGDDEFWYSNPPTSYIEANNLNTNRGNGAFREVFVRIDGYIVASEVPFPVIFTGGINPLFWEPVVAIGAFDLPSYDFDLTPFLGSLLDGKSHSFELGVANAIRFWLVDANLHIWLDKESSKVEAKTGFYQPPEFHDLWENKFKQLDGSFKVEAERKSQSSGWVAYSRGNLTTSIAKRIKFKNSITFQKDGTYKMVKQKVQVKMEVKVVSELGSLISRRTLKRNYPLSVITSTISGPEKDTSMMITNISHALKEKSSNGKLSSSVHNSQESGGWMLVKDHSVISGMAGTQQTLSYQGDSGCYVRNVEASDGELMRDDSTSLCPSLFHNLLQKLLSIW